MRTKAFIKSSHLLQCLPSHLAWVAYSYTQYRQCNTTGLFQPRGHVKPALGHLGRKLITRRVVSNASHPQRSPSVYALVLQDNFAIASAECSICLSIGVCRTFLRVRSRKKAFGHLKARWRWKAALTVVADIYWTWELACKGPDTTYNEVCVDIGEAESGKVIDFVIVVALFMSTVWYKYIY